MGFLRNLFKGKATPVTATVRPVDEPAVDATPEALASRRVRKKAANGIARDFIVDTEEAQGDVAIWDLDGAAGGSDAAPAAAPSEAAKVAAPAPAAKGKPRPRRNKTRIIGFESSSSEIVSLFEASQGDAPSGPAIEPTRKTAEPIDADLPVGWLVVIDGAGRGSSFTLTAGTATIGSALGQDIRLDFGDASVTEMGHAEVSFDANGFQVKPGAGKVFLNDAPVTKSASMANGDTLRVGETSLRFAALCDDDFGWTTAEPKESGNVASA